MKLLQIKLLLVAALSFLSNSIGTPAQPIAIQTATTAINIAREALLAEMPVQGQIGTATSTPADPVPVQNAPVPVEITNSAPVPTVSTPMSQARIEIISPIAGKGLGRDPYTAADPIVDESNYVEIGAVLYGDDGAVLNTPEMVVTATDDTQDKTMEGTGTLYGQRPNFTYYYPFHYEFHTPGDHTITFSANGLTQIVTIHAN